MNNQNTMKLQLVKTAPLCILITLVFIISGCATQKTNEDINGLAIKPAIALSATEEKVYQKALNNLKNGGAEKATLPLAELADNHSGNVAIWINLANAYYQEKKWDKAQNTIDHAYKIDPSIGDIHNLKGLLAVENGQYQSAEKEYLQAISKKPTLADAHYNLALLYDVFYQDLQKAIAHYEKYLALNTTEDEDTKSWVEELKLNLANRSE